MTDFPEATDFPDVIYLSDVMVLVVVIALFALTLHALEFVLHALERAAAKRKRRLYERAELIARKRKGQLRE